MSVSAEKRFMTPMKKTVIIGKFGEITKEINDCLAQFCRVQLCSDNDDIIKGMMKLVMPDLAVVSLPGISLPLDKIFPFLSREYSELPILVVGSRDDQMEMGACGYLKNEQIHFLRRPVKLNEIAKCAKELLQIEEEPVEKRRTILVVDDNPTLLRLVQSLLEKEYVVTFATSGSQAIASTAKKKPDLILLDYDMPVCDGRMTLQMLRSEKETQDIPVVFLTGMADPAYVQALLALHPQGYLLKPPTEEKLFATIKRALAMGVPHPQ